MNEKRLYRSRTDRMVGGVCAGVAEYFDIDPTIVRLLFVLLTLTPANGLLIYIVLLLVMPLEP
jgi:phage shock protein C